MPYHRQHCAHRPLDSLRSCRGHISPTESTCFTSHGVYLFHIPRNLPVSHPTGFTCFTSHGIYLFHILRSLPVSQEVEHIPLDARTRPTRTPRRQNTQEQLRGSIYYIMFDDDNPTTPTLARRRDTLAFGLRNTANWTNLLGYETTVHSHRSQWTT